MFTDEVETHQKRLSRGKLKKPNSDIRIDDKEVVSSITLMSRNEGAKVEQAKSKFHRLLNV